MSLTRKDWRQRLIDADLPEEVVDGLLAQVKDEDLVRMKEMSAEDLVAALKDAVLKESDVAEEDDEEAAAKIKAEKGKKPTKVKAGDEDDDEEEDEEEEKKDESSEALKDIITAIVTEVVAQVKDQMSIQEIEVDVPELAGIIESVAGLTEQLDSVYAVIKDMAVVLKDASQDETTVIHGMVDNLSSAQRSRLSLSLGAAQERVGEFQRQRATARIKGNGGSPTAPVDGVVIKDSDGNEYASLMDMATDRPLGAG